MSKDQNQFEWNYTDFQRFAKLCIAENCPADLALFKRGEREGLVFLTPLTRDGERDQSQHCLLLSWGGDSPHDSLSAIIEFIRVNFVNCRFHADICDVK